MNGRSAADAAKLREEASMCRLLAQHIGLIHEARRLLAEGQVYDARAEAIEKALKSQQVVWTAHPSRF
jgi:hypothetical protein